MNLDWRYVGFTLLISFTAFSSSKELVPENCNCRDWYGGCRQLGESWTDDSTWSYRCSATDGSAAAFAACEPPAGVSANTGRQQIPVGENRTIDSFWYSCEADEVRQRFSQEPRCIVNATNYHVGDKFRQGVFEWVCLESGRWVTGCFYQNETQDWVLLKIGETGYNGLIRHTCDRYKDNPGRVQYHAEIRDDIPYKNPSNKGINKNFPELVDNRLKGEPTPWTHANVAAFIANDANAPGNTKVRFLPKSRAIHQPF